MIKIIIKESISKIKKQIHVLEIILKQEHKSGIEVNQALNALKEGLKALENVENVPSPAGRKKTVDAALVKSLRKEGKTQEQVARKLNISISTVRRNEK
ncbi:helix-turn-helix transcriptional regulator [Clostridium lacusfryxellense]|uniref:helix-turn-helix transcriptional regulator n=1 Tax=Clostridium lacusfryxellense TaxID=205328 RepID=UPI001C0BE661|nr:helix-turn-helix transcriptional regulator [Clostridium lacusfryxellense]MBU3114783.1 helix-turn-helix domain-containing protein [Clostridium lacusfryxellense]